jgi:CheY-like chemotaxis protein
VRRRILVIDNEEADRELLVTLLQPLGFEVRTAASGHDGLDLLAAGVQPDAVLLDLAMPGIDGWETLRRLRALGGAQPQVAIVSANAFDRVLDNSLGIEPQDYVLKPLRHSELLDWLERKLNLVWQEAPASTAPGAPPPDDAPADEPVQPPPRAALLALQELVKLGYFRGIMNSLQATASAHPESVTFIAKLTQLARQYQFETMMPILQKALDESPCP